MDGRSLGESASLDTPRVTLGLVYTPDRAPLASPKVTFAPVSPRRRSRSLGASVDLLSPNFVYGERVIERGIFRVQSPDIGDEISIVIKGFVNNFSKTVECINIILSFCGTTIFTTDINLSTPPGPQTRYFEITDRLYVKDSLGSVKSAMTGQLEKVTKGPAIVGIISGNVFVSNIAANTSFTTITPTIPIILVKTSNIEVILTLPKDSISMITVEASVVENAST